MKTELTTLLLLTAVAAIGFIVGYYIISPALEHTFELPPTPTPAPAIGKPPKHAVVQIYTERGIYAPTTGEVAGL